MRAVCAPLPDPRLIDLDTGRLVISDKDTQDGRHTRIVFVPESVCRQVSAYFRHVSRLPAAIFYSDLRMADEMSYRMRAYAERVAASDA